MESEALLQAPVMQEHSLSRSGVDCGRHRSDAGAIPHQTNSHGDDAPPQRVRRRCGNPPAATATTDPCPRSTGSSRRRTRPRHEQLTCPARPRHRRSRRHRRDTEDRRPPAIHGPGRSHAGRLRCPSSSRRPRGHGIVVGRCDDERPAAGRDRRKLTWLGIPESRHEEDLGRHGRDVRFSEWLHDLL